MNSLVDSIYFFLFITAELTVLFLGISTAVNLIFMYIPQDKLKNWMSGKGIWGNVIGVLFGAITPFCACSTVPVTLGLLKAGVPFGTVISFVISSPLMDPLILTMLAAFMGWKVAVTFLVITSIAAVIFGFILEKMGGARFVKQIQPTGCGCEEAQEETPGTFTAKFKISFLRACGDFRAIFLYLLVGVGVGAVIYGYLPEDFLVNVAGPDNPFAIPVAALIGVPLYVRVETAIPIGLALMQKGVSLGAVMALIIGGAGMAIPELAMLARIFEKKLIAAFVAIVYITAVLAGVMFNMLL